MKLLACLAALVLGAIGAAESDEPVPLPPWIVTESPWRPEAFPVRATALVTSDAWAEHGMVTLADTFRGMPGAILQESFGGFEPPRLSIRGSGIQSAPSSRGVALLLDGIPLGLSDGSFNAALLDPLLTHAAYVQRGLDGWREAPSCAGGALDFQNGVFRENERGVRAEAGAFGFVSVHAIDASHEGAFGAMMAAGAGRQDGFRAHSGQYRYAANAAIERTWGEGGRAALSVYGARLAYDVPGPLTLTAALLMPRTITADVQRDQPRREADVARIVGNFTRTTDDDEMQLSAGVARTSDDFRQLQANGITVSRSDDLFLRAAWTRKVRALGFSQEIQARATAAKGWRDQTKQLNLAGKLGPAFGRDRLVPVTTSFDLEDTIAVTDQATASIGLARVDARRDISDRLAEPTSSTRKIGSGATLPSASVRWRPTLNHVLFASFSEVAEPPTYDDLLVVAGSAPALVRRSQNLDTQRASTAELGARGRWGGLSWDAAVYRSAWKSEILRLADARGVPLGAVNASPTTHEGIETSARWVVREKPWRVSLATTAVWTRFVFADDPVYGRNRLAGIPPHLGTAEVRVESPRGLFVAGGADWTAGSIPVDHANKLTYGGSTLAHVRAGWRNARGWTAFFEMRNVFDRRAIASTAGVLDLARNPASTSIFLPAVGRQCVLGVEWRK